MFRRTALCVLPFVLGMATAQEPPPPANILLMVADDWGYGHASGLGCRWVHTPAFDRVMREGVVFTNAYTPNAKCSPSRSCILTGRNPWQLGAACNHSPYFPAEFQTFPLGLEALGLATGMTGKGWGPGDALDVAGRPRALAGKAWNHKTAKPPTTGMSKYDYAANFAAFLDAAPAGRPWCFWYGAQEPHRDYEYGSGVAKGGKSLADIDRVPAYWPDTPAVRHDMLDYAFEIEHADRHIGLMLAELERRGQLDNTLVIVTSDNGMPFPRVKGQEYAASCHLPLAMRWPAGIPHGGRTVDDLVSLIDLAPTIVEAIGQTWPATGMAPAGGRSLMPQLRSPLSGRVDPARDHVLIGRERNDVGRPQDQGYPIRGIVTSSWCFMQNYEPTRWPAGDPVTGYLDCDGSPTKTAILEARRQHGHDRYWDLCFGKRGAEEFYAVDADPDCVNDRSADPTVDAQRRALKALMERELSAQQDPRMHGQGAIFEAHPYAGKVRGFYERLQADPGLRADWVSPGDADKELP
jgi:N-sulfoglucosamine sulfohydrolase